MRPETHLFTAVFNNMRTLKFKPQPTVAFFAAVNQISGGFRLLPTATGKARGFSNTNMVRKYGSSLRWRVVFLHVNHHLSPREIVRFLKVGKTFVHKVLKLYSETKGVDYSLNHNRGKPRSIGGKYA